MESWFNDMKIPKQINFEVLEVTSYINIYTYKNVHTDEPHEIWDFYMDRVELKNNYIEYLENLSIKLHDEYLSAHIDINYFTKKKEDLILVIYHYIKLLFILNY